MTKGIREASFETKKIIERLSALNPGESLSYRDIQEMCGLSSLAPCRGYIQTARRTLRSDGVLFEAIRGQGLRRMTDEQIATQCPSWRRRRIRVQAREMVKDIGAIQSFASLSDEAQLSVYVAQSEAAIIQKATDRGAETKLRDASRAKKEQLAIGESLRLLMTS